MKKLLVVLALVVMVVMSGCEEEKVEQSLRVTQHDSGEVTICMFTTYEDGREESDCDLFVLEQKGYTKEEVDSMIQDLKDELNIE